MAERKQVLILCTGNSCRSQMAEGWINHELGDRWQAVSAGTEPAGYVHPLAVAAMAEAGIDLGEAVSENASRYRGRPFDVVITVCDDAAENCPVWLGEGKKVHIGFPDPAQATGTEAERMAVFRRVRDDIRHRVLEYLQAFADSQEEQA